MKTKRLKTFIFMFVATVFAKALGLIRSIIFANYFGTGASATAFFTATKIPLQILDIFLLSAIVSVFIPIYIEVVNKEGEKTAKKFANNFTNIIGLIAVVISIIGIMFAPIIVKLLAGGLDNSTYILTVSLIRITFPTIVFSGRAYVFVAFLQANDEFNIPSLISCLSNFILITYLIIFGDVYGIYGVVIALVLGWLSQVLIQIPSIIKKQYKFKFCVDFKDKYWIKAMKLAVPIILITLTTPINNIVNLRIASEINHGTAISALEYSYNVYLLAGGLFALVLSNLVFPQLSKYSIKKNYVELKNLLKKALNILITWSIPITVIFLILGYQIIQILYERGEFTSNSTLLTSTALFFYSLAILPYGINELMNKSFYSMQNTKTPFKVGIISIIINLILSLLLSKYMGIGGITLSYAITMTIISILLILIYSKKYGDIIDFNLFKDIICVILSSILMGCFVFFLNEWLNSIFINNILYEIFILIVDFIVGMFTYIVFSIALKNKIIIDVIDSLKLKKKSGD